MRCRLSDPGQYRLSKTKISRLEFGWWYVRYCFVFHPYAAFDVFCEEYKKQNNIDDDVEVLDIFDHYKDFKEPSGILPTLINEVSKCVFRIKLLFSKVKAKGLPF